MAMRWRTIALTGFLSANFLGCSGSAGKNEPSAQGGSGGQATENRGGAAGASARGGRAGVGGRSSGGGSFGAGGFLQTAGAAGSGLEGGSDSGAVPAGWGCIYFAYDDGKCDCGCGVPDKDCSGSQLAQCESCDTVGSCSALACPGRIDPDDVGHCIVVPAGWTCAPSAYQDGKVCDCGCGVPDKDCSDAAASSCDNCSGVGSCANGPCPSSLTVNDNTRCEIPPAWSCDAATYGDGVCNCGCSIVDVDCPDAKATSCRDCDRSSCSPFDCFVDPDDNAHCTKPPALWNCSPRLYHDGGQCDCGCGAIDPDCESIGVEACDKCDAPGSCAAHACPGLISAKFNARCDQPEPPAKWTCAAGAYADGIACDCGCGVEDPDCRNADITTCERCFACGGHGVCEGTIDPKDSTQCAPPPTEWTCSAAAFRDSVCDCGCGLLDSYCQDIELLYVCGNYPIEGCSAGNKAHIDPNHNFRCLINVPKEWSCDRGYYYDGLCDCGCGALDLDCASNDVSACGKCDDVGSCSGTACPGTISKSDIAHCG